MKKISPNHFSFIIPTIGRSSLIESLRSIREDSQETKIIVVGCEESRDVIKKMTQPFNVSLYFSRKGSITENLNIGLNFLCTDFFGFFSDDDTWIKGSMDIVLKHLAVLSPNQFLLGSVLFSDKRSEAPHLRPTTLIENSVGEIFGSPVLKSNPRYMSLTAFAGRKEMSRIFFRQNLTFWEDFIWLLDQECAGWKPKQINFPLSSVNVDHRRLRTRGSLKVYLELIQIIRSIDSRIQTIDLVFSIAKNFVHAKDLPNLWIFIWKVRSQLRVRERFKLFLIIPLYVAKIAVSTFAS